MQNESECECLCLDCYEKNHCKNTKCVGVNESWRERCKEDFRKFGMQTSPTNKPASFEEIGEWWLSKIESELNLAKQEEREAVIDEIRQMPIKVGEVLTLLTNKIYSMTNIKEQEMEERYNNVFYAGTNPAILVFIKEELSLCRSQLLQEIEERVKEKSWDESGKGDRLMKSSDLVEIINSFK